LFVLDLVEDFCAVANFAVVFCLTTVHLTDIVDLVRMSKVVCGQRWARVIRIENRIGRHEQRIGHRTRASGHDFGLVGDPADLYAADGIQGIHCGVLIPQTFLWSQRVGLPILAVPVQGKEEIP